MRAIGSGLLTFTLCCGMLPALLWGQSEETALGAEVDSLLAAGKLKSAVRVVENARKKSGDHSLLRWKLAELRLRAREYDRAVSEYAAYLKEDPSRYSGLEGRLRQLAAEPQHADHLLKALAAAAAAAEDGLQLSLLASSCALVAAKPELGLELLAPFGGDSQTSIVVLQYGHTCEAKGFLEAAAAAYGQYAAENPSSPQYYTALVRQAAVVAALGKHAAAAELYTRLAREFADRPEAPEALLVLSRLYLEELNEPRMARALLLEVAQVSVGTARGLTAAALMVESALRLDDLEQASSIIEDLGAEAARSYQLRLQRAEIRYFQGEFGQAADSLEHLLLADLQEELANDALALLLVLSDYAEQPAALEVLARAQLLERQQRAREAARDWRWLQRKGPASLQPLSLLLQAEHLMEAGDDVTAFDLLEGLVKTFPESPYTLDARLQLADIHLRDGQQARALKTFETAVLAHPQDARTPEIRLRIQRLRTEQQRGPG